MADQTRIKVGAKVELPDGETGTVVAVGGPGDELRVKLANGIIASVDPLSTEVKIVKDNTTNKEDAKMAKTTQETVVKQNVQEIPVETAVESRVLPEISPDEILVSSKQYVAPLPSGARVKVSFRKLTSNIGKLVVEDELGSRTFTVMASKRNAGEIYIPQVETKPYTTRNGKEGEAVVLECHGQANALLVAIAKRVMAAEGITLGRDEEDLELLPVDDIIPF